LNHIEDLIHFKRFMNNEIYPIIFIAAQFLLSKSFVSNSCLGNNPLRCDPLVFMEDKLEAQDGVYSSCLGFVQAGLFPVSNRVERIS